MNPDEQTERAQGTIPTQVEQPVDLALAATAGSNQLALEGADLPRGASFGRYIVLDRLGAGNMGVVYGAYDPELDRKIALKFLKANIGDPAGRARLLREAQAMAKLAHPNVVTVHDVGTFGDDVFVAMEFVQGVTLRHWLDERPRTWREVVDVFVAAGRGLAAAHEASLVHRDLKPDNIMIGTDARVRVMDFGLARASAGDAGSPESAAAALPQLPQFPKFPQHGPAPKLELTRTGSLVGTPAYMAPEQWNGSETDARTDQFAYCVTLWEALHGERPFRGASLAALMLAVTNGELRSPADPRRAPAWLRQVLIRGLAVSPSGRWPSMAALLLELGRDRQAPLRRWGAALAGVTILLAGGLGVAQVVEKRSAAAAERERADLAETEAAAARERADRAAFERTALEDAGRSAEVLRLATSSGRERDALVLGVQVLAPFGPTFEDAPFAAVDGLSRSISAMLPLATISRPGHPVQSVKFSQDGSLFVAALWEGLDVQIWSTAPVAHLRTISMPLDTDVRGPLISPDNRFVVGSDDERCFVFDMAKGEHVRDISGCDDPFFSIDSTTLFGKAPSRTKAEVDTGVMSHKELRAWNLANGAQLWSTPIAGDYFIAKAHPDGVRLVIAGQSPAPEIFTADSGLRIGQQPAHRWPKSWKGPGALRAEDTLAISPNGTYVAISNFTSDSGLNVFDLDAHRTQELPEKAWSVVFSQDSQRLVASTSEHAAIYVHGPQWTLWHSIGVEPWPVAASASEEIVTDGTALWLTRSRLLRQTLRHPLRSNIAISPGGSMFATVASDLAVLWNAADLSDRDRWNPPSGERVTYYDNTIVSTKDDAGVIRLNDRQGAEPPIVLSGTQNNEGNRSAAWDVGFPAWEVGAWIWQTSPLRLHDRRSGVEVYRHTETDVGGWQTAAPARQSSILAGATLAGSVDVIDAATSRVICSIPGDGTHVDEVRIDDAGERVALLRSSGVLSVWSAISCIQWAAMTPFGDSYISRKWRTWPEGSLDFSADGSLYLRTGGITLLYDSESGGERWALEDCPRSNLGFSRVSPDGRYLLTSCENIQASGMASIWDIESESKVASVDLGEFNYSRLGTVQPFAPFAHSGNFLAFRTAQGHLAILDTESGEETLRLYMRDPLVDFRIREGDQLVDVRDESGVLHTYPVTRAGLFAAACKALARTEVAHEVQGPCAPYTGAIP